MTDSEPGDTTESIQKDCNPLVAITLILSALLRKREHRAWQRHQPQFWLLSTSTSESFHAGFRLIKYLCSRASNRPILAPLARTPASLPENVSVPASELLVNCHLSLVQLSLIHKLRVILNG